MEVAETFTKRQSGKELANSWDFAEFPSFYIDKKIFSVVKLYEITKGCGQMKFHALLYII